MSKGFTKDDATDEPLVVPARAPLPAGTPNYVTTRGLELLRDELAALTSQRARAQAKAADEDADASREASILATRIGELDLRIAAAIVVGAAASPGGEARFGCVVEVRGESGPTRRYRIVGVDEANAAEGLVAFTSPIARALFGKRAGEVAVVRTPRGDEELEVVSVTPS